MYRVANLLNTRHEKIQRRRITIFLSITINKTRLKTIRNQFSVVLLNGRKNKLKVD